MSKRVVDIDMAALALAWEDESPDTAYYLDLETGCVELVQQDMLDRDDLTDQIERDRERYLYMPKPKAKQLRADLNDFIETVADAHLKQLLEVACESPNPLYSCRSLLTSKYPEVWENWETFRKGRVALRIRQWLQANFIADPSEVVTLD